MLLRQVVKFSMVLYVCIPRGTRRFIWHLCRTGTFSSLHCRLFFDFKLLEQTVYGGGFRSHVFNHVHYLRVMELANDPFDISWLLLVHRLDYLVFDSQLFSLLAQVIRRFQVFYGAFLDGVLLRNGMRGIFPF